MTAEHTVQAWKDPDLREALGMPAHPAGEIELDADSLAGGSGTPISAISVATITVCTTNLSCWPEPACNDSIGHGTCGWFSYGCC
jgi:mersacidin/lichenicidin family type 2 lantibiotic